jgi:hypothetical protein
VRPPALFLWLGLMGRALLTHPTDPLAAKVSRSVVARYCSMRSAFSMMSARLWVGSFLEGTQAIPVYVRGQARFFDRLGQEVDAAA